MSISQNSFCEFSSEDGMNYECNNCGIKLRSFDGDPPVFICKKPLHRQSDDKTFSEKLKNFAKATIDHISTGMKLCSEEKIIERHNICRSCEFFKEDTCSKCGCLLIRNKRYISKLAWADQECPVGKWKKEI